MRLAPPPPPLPARNGSALQYLWKEGVRSTMYTHACSRYLYSLLYVSGCIGTHCNTRVSTCVLYSHTFTSPSCCMANLVVFSWLCCVGNCFFLAAQMCYYGGTRTKTESIIHPISTWWSPSCPGWRGWRAACIRPPQSCSGGQWWGWRRGWSCCRSPECPAGPSPSAPSYETAPPAPTTNIAIGRGFKLTY